MDGLGGSETTLGNSISESEESDSPEGTVTSDLSLIDESLRDEELLVEELLIEESLRDEPLFSGWVLTGDSTVSTGTGLTGSDGSDGSDGSSSESSSSEREKRLGLFDSVDSVDSVFRLIRLIRSFDLSFPSCVSLVIPSGLICLIHPGPVCPCRPRFPRCPPCLPPCRPPGPGSRHLGPWLGAPDCLVPSLPSCPRADLQPRPPACRRRPDPGPCRSCSFVFRHDSRL